MAASIRGPRAPTAIVEKDLVLAFAQHLKKKLEQFRPLSGFVDPRPRHLHLPGRPGQAARAAKADLFISIHADSISGGQDVRGLTVYTGSERASDADSARLADRENKADAAAGLESAEGPDEVRHPAGTDLTGDAELFAPVSPDASWASSIRWPA